MELDNKVEINIEKIMEEIRAEIKEKQLLEEIPSFEDIPIQGQTSTAVVSANISEENYREHYLENLDYLNRNVEMIYYFDLGNNPVKKFIKRAIRKVLKFLLYPITQQQTAFNAHAVRCLNATRDYMQDQTVKSNVEDMMNLQIERLAELEQKYNAQKKELETWVQKSREALEQRETEQESTIAALEEKIKALQIDESERKDRESSLKKQIEELSNELSHVKLEQIKLSKRLEEQLENRDRESDDFSAKIAKAILSIQTTKTGEKSGLIPTKQKIENENGKDTDTDKDKDKDNSYIAIDYFAFQNAFRGTRKQIKERQAIYLPYFKPSNVPVLDIGCGRGEFLQLMKEQQISAFGIDLYPEYVVEGTLHGLDIRQGDGIDFLQNTELQFGGIMVSQVIEHIGFERLQLLCKAAYDKLQKNAYLILETPNPMSLSVFTNSFYLDPTHQRPVHPLMLQYLLKEIGFSDVKLLFTEESKMEPLPKIKSDAIENLEEINAGIRRVSDMLFASQDYAIIAKK